MGLCNGIPCLCVLFTAPGRDGFGDWGSVDQSERILSAYLSSTTNGGVRTILRFYIHYRLETRVMVVQTDFRFDSTGADCTTCNSFPCLVLPGLGTVEPMIEAIADGSIARFSDQVMRT